MLFEWNLMRRYELVEIESGVIETKAILKNKARVAFIKHLIFCIMNYTAREEAFLQAPGSSA